MSDTLPKFEMMDRDRVYSLVADIFKQSQHTGTQLVTLERYNDGHFRAVFKSSYFSLPDGSDLPTKSQWGTLKKKLKRHYRQIFVFKAWGTVPCDAEAADCFYIDFGFVKE
jgi:hypothetical protein